MEGYLSAYGWHFNKKMCEWAIKRLKDRNDNPVSVTKEDVDTLLGRYSITLNHAKGYDHVYVAARIKAVCFGSSVQDDSHWAMAIKDEIDDPNCYDGVAFTRFYADCIGKGEPIIWEDML